MATRKEARAFVRDGEIWFTDGNVVLETQRHAFRVYQGPLAQHSPVFRDLFTVPQPTPVEMLEGCPVVHLPDDSEDLRHLLRVLFPGPK